MFLDLFGAVRRLQKKKWSFCRPLVSFSSIFRAIWTPKMIHYPFKQRQQSSKFSACGGQKSRYGPKVSYKKAPPWKFLPLIGGGFLIRGGFLNWNTPDAYIIPKSFCPMRVSRVLPCHWVVQFSPFRDVPQFRPMSPSLSPSCSPADRATSR